MVVSILYIHDYINWLLFRTTVTLLVSVAWIGNWINANWFFHVFPMSTRITKFEKRVNANKPSFYVYIQAHHCDIFHMLWSTMYVTKEKKKGSNQVKMIKAKYILTGVLHLCCLKAAEKADWSKLNWYWQQYFLGFKEIYQIAVYHRDRYIFTLATKRYASHKNIHVTGRTYSSHTHLW